MTGKTYFTAERLAEIQAGFVAALPRMNRVLDFRFRRLRGDKRDEDTAEATAICWKAYLRLHERGIDPAPLINKIAQFAAKTVNSGGRLMGMQSVNDIMSPTCRHRRGHSVESLSISEADKNNPDLLDALHDKRSRPADEAAFKVDLDEFIDGLSPRHRDVVKRLASGLNTVETGEKRGESRAVVSNHRRQILRKWDDVNGEDRGR